MSQSVGTKNINVSTASHEPVFYDCQIKITYYNAFKNSYYYYIQ